MKFSHKLFAMKKEFPQIIRTTEVLSPELKKKGQRIEWFTDFNFYLSF